MESLKRMRENSQQKPHDNGQPRRNEGQINYEHSHLINGLELHLHTILSTEDRCQWTASHKSGTIQLRTQFLVRILTHYVINRRRMIIDSLERIRDKSIPPAIPCPDSYPSYQWTRAALTVYIINRRRMAMDSVEQIRDQSIPTTIPCPDS